jgi:NAD+ synthetase
VRVALAQIDTAVGDFPGNVAKIARAIDRAREAGAHMLVLPELAVCGYPPLDLLDRASFLSGNERALRVLAERAPELAVVVGAVTRAPGGSPRSVANAAVVLRGGGIAHVQAKTLLPTYDVFDEVRYFEPARERHVFAHAGARIGLAVCEDFWSGEFWGERRRYPIDPVADLVAQGAELLVQISASPFAPGKIALREQMVGDAARRHRVPVISVNLVGGNDELIFDGASFVVSHAGVPVLRLARLDEDFACVEVTAPTSPGQHAMPPREVQVSAELGPIEPPIELLERALVLGIRDYLHKQGFTQCVIGLSGGIDSAVTAHLATLALGAENVLGIAMPGPYSSSHSVTDALHLGDLLGIETRVVRIDAIFAAYLETFAALLGERSDYGLTQENVQARIRGSLLMAVSNFTGRIVLATGNKSELSVGYTTLYGDLVGGVAVIGDVLKGDVYALARHANRRGERIPWSTIEKPPSAELRPDQRDSDSLPEYPALDAVLRAAIEGGASRTSLALELPHIDAQTIGWVLGALDRAEYKRRQAPIILRVSEKAFGIGRRVPIVQRCGYDE